MAQKMSLLAARLDASNLLSAASKCSAEKFGAASTSY